MVMFNLYTKFINRDYDTNVKYRSYQFLKYLMTLSDEKFEK